jgi:hypothetical protein
MTQRPNFSSFSEMPEALQAFLFSDVYAQADEDLRKTYNLSNEQRTMIGDKTMDAVFHDIELPETLSDIKTALVPTVVPEEKWKDFLSDVLKLEIWPLRELFGEELTKILQENQIRTVGWPSSRVMLKPLTYGGAASEIASQCGFSLMGGQMRERLRDLIISKIKGVRIDSEVRATLMRQADFGGLGLDAAMADKAVATMNSLFSSVQIMTEDEYADWLSAEARKKAAPPEPVHAGADEDPEIAAIRARMPDASHQPKTVLDEAIASTYAKITDHPKDDYLDKRLRHVISSRLRDVRSQIELKQLLQRDSKVGGLGLAKDVSERMASQIEEGYQSYHDRILTEEKQNLDAQLEEQRKKVEERKKREAEEHAEWYREKVLARKQTEDDQKKMAEQMKQVMGDAFSTVPAHPIDVKEKKAETERFGELVPAVAAGAKPVAAPIVSSAVQSIMGPNLPSQFPTASSAPIQSPAPTSQTAPAASSVGNLARPEVKVSKATAEMMVTANAFKPRMDDVKMASPRLTGPVQELRALTLSEFRRMAKDPTVAVQKILQKVEILHQESFERRVEGIRAFQESGLQQSYMALVAESFRTGKPISELADEKRSKGSDVPSPAELSAIISLNSKLHF